LENVVRAPKASKYAYELEQQQKYKRVVRAQACAGNESWTIPSKAILQKLRGIQNIGEFQFFRLQGLI
jgi:hypothetical protein